MFEVAKTLYAFFFTLAVMSSLGGIEKALGIQHAHAEAKKPAVVQEEPFAETHDWHNFFADQTVAETKTIFKYYEEKGVGPATKGVYNIGDVVCHQLDKHRKLLILDLVIEENHSRAYYEATYVTDTGEWKVGTFFEFELSACAAD